MGSNSHFAYLLCIFLSLPFCNTIQAWHSNNAVSATSTISEEIITCREQDSLALVDFYNNTGGEDWNIKWDLNTPISTWYGISTNETGCVICIDLDGEIGCNISVAFGNGLTGLLPESIGDLKSLEKLLLGNNEISSVLPVSLFDLPLTRVIDVFANEMIGPLPANLGHATELEILSLSGNNIDGNIPPSIGQASSLTELFMDNNRLSGSLPTELGNATKLRRVRLQNNSITGSIPNQLGQLEDLISLNLAENSLSGAIPTQIETLLKLEELILSNNGLTGVIPVEIGDLASLKRLSINSNKFIGPLPSRIGNLENLEQLWAQDNFLTNDIPNEIGQCLMMIDLRANNNKLSGNIPNEIGNLKYLRKVNLSKNRLIGPLPSNLDSLVRLQELIISDNKLSESLPDQIGKLSSIRIIRADNNEFIGPLPSSISDLERLNELQLSDNFIDGDIPEEYGESESLNILDLANNKLTGCFPKSLLTKCDRPYSFDNNTELPWLGDFKQFCTGTSQIDAKCSTETGVPGETIQDDCSCDLFVCVPIHVTQDAFICGNESITVGSSSYYEAGNVIDSLMTKQGCDSIITTSIARLAIDVKTSQATCHNASNGSAEISTSIPGLFDYTVYTTDFEQIAKGVQVNQIPDLENILAAGQYKLVVHETNTECKVNYNFEVVSQYSEIPETYETGLRCHNEEITINGNLYNRENRTGKEVLKSSLGCDSTVIVDLDFIDYELEVTNPDCNNEAYGRIQCSASIDDKLYNYTITNQADEIILSGTNNTGIVDTENTLLPGSYLLELNSEDLGCSYKTTLEVGTNFITPEPFNLEQNLCPGESYFINDHEYNESQLEGVEILKTVNGCDSIVNINVTYLEKPIAEDDLFPSDGEFTTVDVLKNDLITVNQNITLEIINSENVRDVKVDSENNIVLDIDKNFTGISVIEYEICVGDCDLCTTARARVTSSPDGFDEDIITPNNDGYNEVLVVSGYSEYEIIPDCTINIINRWGQVVHSAENYHNDWAGNRNGDKSKPLPEGVYYYHLLYRNGRSVMGSRSLIR